MDHKTIVNDLHRARKSGALDGPPSIEDRSREALDWAIDKTCLAIPARVRDPYAWVWEADDLCLRCLTDDGEFRFHVAGERRGYRKTRIAVMSWEDDDGKATWEADMPKEGGGVRWTT